MKSIDIVVPVSGWSSWYSTGGIITTGNSKINVPLSFENQDLGLGGPISYEIIYWEDGQRKFLTGYYLENEELSVSVGGTDSISNVSFRLKSTLGQHVVARCPLYMQASSSSDVLNLASLYHNNSTPIDIKEKIPNVLSVAETVRSPLVLDLDGDGVETTSVENGTHFDHDSNDFAEKSGWVGKDDGLLVHDKNNNGTIDDGTELFGNNSVLSSGTTAKNGFEALADLDSNNDGIFNSSDTKWNNIKVWKDANGNGIVDEGELLSLVQAGVAGINLDYEASTTVDNNGNEHKQTGTFIKTDGTTGSVHDVWFETDTTDTVDLSNVEIPADIAALPNVDGFGNVHDLHTAMALDESGELKSLVQQYTAETNAETRYGILLNIIYHWTGVQDMDPNGRDPTQVYGKVIDDTRKLEALEEFWGKEYLGTWCWGERDPNPHGQAAPYILQAFDTLKNYVGMLLSADIKNIIKREKQRFILSKQLLAED